MKKTQILAAFAISLLSLSAIAGYLQPAPVIIEMNEDLSGTAGGDMVTARYADNDVELIGCGSTKFSGGFVFGFCQATDAEGNSAFCNTDDAVLLEQMQQTSDYSYVSFSWDSSGTCTRLRFSTQSFYIPENKDQKTNKK